MSVEILKAALRDVPDFPSPGIMFKDITPILKDSKLFAMSIDRLAEPYKNNPPSHFVGIESRGFLFGAALALKLGTGLIPVRKKGKLPWKTLESTYSLEYGTATLEIHHDALSKGDKVVIIDDLLATGGTAAAAISLTEQLGAEVVGVDFLIELLFLDGRKKLSKYKVNSVMSI